MEEKEETKQKRYIHRAQSRREYEAGVMKHAKVITKLNCQTLKRPSRFLVITIFIFISIFIISYYFCFQYLFGFRHAEAIFFSPSRLNTWRNTAEK